MKATPKVLLAIRVLSGFLAVDVAAPFLYQRWLHWKPATPPPVWGASPGYWWFYGSLCALMGLGCTNALALVIVKLDLMSGEYGLAYWVAIQGIAVALATMLSLSMVNEKKRINAATWARLGLPTWPEFSAHWKPRNSSKDLNALWQLQVMQSALGPEVILDKLAALRPLIGTDKTAAEDLLDQLATDLRGISSALRH